jgi:YggT family protein
MVLLRLLAQLAHADFYNPVIQLIVRATNPLLIPVRRVIPPIGKFDTASVILALSLILIEVILLKCIYDGAISLEIFLTPEIYIILFSKLVSMAIKLLIALVIIRIMMSWMQPHERHPATILLTQLTEPMLKPIRRLIPFTALDLSPMILIILLYIIDEITAGYLRILFEAVN